MNILVPNLGSTSLKYQIIEFPSEAVLSRGRFERVTDYRSAIAEIAAGSTPIDAVAFKAVLAGPGYRGTFVIDEGVTAALEQFLPAAPVHNRIYLDAIAAFRDSMPGVPLVAAFETEFHRTIPEYARVYGVPAEWRARDGVERNGFHGASHEFISWRVPEFLGSSRDSLRVISCHLGGSSSICAIQGGRSVDTSMGFSPQSGLENATRHGELDAFAVLYIMDRHGWTTEQVRQDLSRVSGLAGLSGVPGGDARDIAAAGTPAAALALEVLAYQVRKAFGAYAAILGGIDAIAFTGGIGENSAAIRSACCRGLEWLGIVLDQEANENGTGDRLLSSGPVRVLALATNEELIVGRRAYRVLG